MTVEVVIRLTDDFVDSTIDEVEVTELICLSVIAGVEDTLLDVTYLRFFPTFFHFFHFQLFPSPARIQTPKLAALLLFKIRGSKITNMNFSRVFVIIHSVSMKWMLGSVCVAVLTHQKTVRFPPKQFFLKKQGMYMI